MSKSTCSFKILTKKTPWRGKSDAFSFSNSPMLGHPVHPGLPGYDVTWSEQGSGTVPQECGTTLLQERPPIHETVSQMLSVYGIEVR